MTRHLAIVGPTATGKSALAIELAAATGDAEIVSLDAMQVYREMDIGTAKPAPAELAAVPHHLVDVADPSEEWSVRATQQAAAAAVADIEARGRRAILVGGTGLYVRAVVDGLEVPPTDPDVRAGIEGELAAPGGLAAAYERLAAADPAAAARIEPGNARRIARALEVIAVTGRPFSAFGPGLTAYAPPALDVTIAGLGCGPDVLAHRIARRVAVMRAAGFVAEVRALAARPGGLSRTARQAIGYKEVLAALEATDPGAGAGTLGAAPGTSLDGALDAALDRAVVRTRQFARRQRVWFRRDPRIAWFDAGEYSRVLVRSVLARWECAEPSAPEPLTPTF